MTVSLFPQTSLPLCDTLVAQLQDPIELNCSSCGLLSHYFGGFRSIRTGWYWTFGGVGQGQKNKRFVFMLLQVPTSYNA